MQFTLVSKGEVVGIVEAMTRADAEGWVRSNAGRRVPAGSRVAEDDPLERAFRGLGLSESQARDAARGRGGRPLPVYTVERSGASGEGSMSRLVEAFKALGMSEDAARVAAAGREKRLPSIEERRQKRPTDPPRSFEFSESSGRLVYGK
jgi:hypothetical protein